MSDVFGYIHSVDSLGTVDGPGIRYIVFLQGCKMRCLYCHNPDSWPLKQGKKRSVEDLFKEILKTKRYMKTSGGGLTISGGEPLLQPEFVLALLEKAKEEDMHTCIDTNGLIGDEAIMDEILPLVDLVMLDIKHVEEKAHKALSGQSMEQILKFMKKLEKHQTRTWIRQVLVPEWTLSLDYAQKLADMIKPLDYVELVEILPFHQLGAFKWDEMGFPYKLKETQTPQDEEIEAFKNILEKNGLKVRL